MKSIHYFSKNKYNAKRTKCSLGHSHRSKLESHYCNSLQTLKKAGTIKDFEFEKRYPLIVNEIVVGYHKPDFTVTRNDGGIEVHETKGMETADWHIRKNIFEAMNPYIPYIVVK